MTRSDSDHLRVLAICHYVLGGLCFVIGCIPMIHLAIGIAIVTGVIPMQPQGNNGNANGNAPPFPAELFGWFFIGIASAAIAFHWALAVTLAYAGDCLRQRKRRSFCLVAAGFACLMQPLGLVLGIFTFIVLLRPGVRAAFEPASENPPEPLPEAQPADPDERDRYRPD